MPYVKTPHFSDLTHLTASQAGELELECLIVLEKTSCTCKRALDTHFPAIITAPRKPHRPMTMTTVGVSLDVLTKRKLHSKRFARCPDFAAQMECICRSLEVARVRHLDMPVTGQNLCLGTAGELYLIDFDVAVVRSKPMSANLGYLMASTGASRAEYNDYLTRAATRAFKAAGSRPKSDSLNRLKRLGASGASGASGAVPSETHDEPPREDELLEDLSDSRPSDPTDNAEDGTVGFTGLCAVERELTGDTE